MLFDRITFTAYLPNLPIPWWPSDIMARKRRETSPSKIKLKQPDRSTPTEATLLQFAQERGLFEEAQQAQQESRTKPAGPADVAEDDGSGLSPTAERMLDTILWMISLSMLHFTLDVLVQNQYAVEISWSHVAQRAGQALVGKIWSHQRGKVQCRVSS